MPERDMSGTASATSAEQDSPASISVMDLLRAIFMPESIGADMVESIGENMVKPLATVKAAVAEEPTQPPLAVTGETGVLAEAQMSTDVVATAEQPEEATPAQQLGLVLGVSGSLLLGYMAQNSLSVGRRGTTGALFYTLAVLLWLFTLIFEFGPPDDRWRWLHGASGTTGQKAKIKLPVPLLERLLSIDPARLYMAAAGVLLSALTYVATANNRFTVIGVLAWVGSIVLWVMTLSEHDGIALFDRDAGLLSWMRRPTFKLQMEPFVFATLLLMVIAAFFPLFPPGCRPERNDQRPCGKIAGRLCRTERQIQRLLSRQRRARIDSNVSGSLLC